MNGHAVLQNSYELDVFLQLELHFKKNVMGVAVLPEHFSNLFHFISIKPIEVERQLEFNWQMKVNHCLLNTNCRTTTCFIEDTDVFVNSLLGTSEQR